MKQNNSYADFFFYFSNNLYNSGHDFPILVKSNEHLQFMSYHITLILNMKMYFVSK